MFDDIVHPLHREVQAGRKLSPDHEQFFLQPPDKQFKQPIRSHSRSVSPESHSSAADVTRLPAVGIRSCSASGNLSPGALSEGPREGSFPGALRRRRNSLIGAAQRTGTSLRIDPPRHTRTFRSMDTPAPEEPRQPPPPLKRRSEQKGSLTDIVVAEAHNSSAPSHDHDPTFARAPSLHRTDEGSMRNHRADEHTSAKPPNPFMDARNHPARSQHRLSLPLIADAPGPDVSCAELRRLRRRASCKADLSRLGGGWRGPRPAPRLLPYTTRPARTPAAAPPSTRLLPTERRLLGPRH